MPVKINKKKLSKKVTELKLDNSKLTDDVKSRDLKNIPDFIRQYMAKFFPLAMWKVMIGYEKFTEERHVVDNMDEGDFERYHKAGQRAISHLDTLISAEQRSKKHLTQDEELSLGGEINPQDLERAMKNIKKHEKFLQKEKK